MFSKSQKRAALGTAILVIVVLFVVPAINVNRFRLQVARSLSQALGREVTVQGISIQTFPQPGLLLSGVVVDDDPTISAEPILRADEVLATLRISSLWRGRLEIGTLKLRYPSLNLVRSNDGRWNLESLLERARETPTAPTAKKRPETRARFPYIESDGGRINLKIGNEKKVFALSDADFAIWLASENEWRMRLEARPIRTDANLSDTGTLKVQGSWRRAPQLHETPVSLSFSWEGGQLGQITHLIYGWDRGWRGGVRVSGSVSGKPEDFAMRLDARIDDFRRYDILSPESVVLQVHCASDYHFTEKQIRNLACQMPAGSGVVLVNGSYDFLPRPRLDLSVAAENVPMQFLITVARHAKRDMPSDMNVSGMLSAVVAGKDDYCSRTWAGNGALSEVQLRSSVLSAPVILPPSRWSLIVPKIESQCTEYMHRDEAANDESTSGARKLPKQKLPTPDAIAWKLEPVSLKLGDASPATLSGWFSHDGYYTDLHGDADLQRLFEIAKLAGLPTPASDVSGFAKGAVQVSGEWAGFGAPTVTGDAQLKNITARFSGVAAPLRITSAHFTATKDAFDVTKAAGSFTGVHSDLQFSASWPQNCRGNGSPLNCALEFNVLADELNLDEVNALLNPRAQKQPWYAALTNTVMGSKRSKFPEVFARGQVSSGKVLLKNVTASHFSSLLTIAPSEFSLTNITADVFGGKYSGEIQADLSGATPAYVSEGKLQSATMVNVATLMKDAWASGSASVTYRGQLSGWDADELLSSATATAKFEWRNGALPHIELASAGKALQFKTFSGTLNLSGGVLTILPSKLQAGSGIYLVSGTASLGRRLQLRIAREGAPGYSITGTLEKPTIALLREPDSQSKIRPSSNR